MITEIRLQSNNGERTAAFWSAIFDVAAPVSVARPTLPHMSVVASTERCACPDPHPTADGRCVEPSIRSEDPGDPTLAKYAWCGCCMADCPDVHPDSDRGLRAVPGSAVMAQEYFDTLPAEKQESLRAQEARGELRIAPRSEMAVDPDRIRILRSALKHSGEADAPDD